ncbi:hypothetical protein LAZ40_09360 [Cereibacter sphaeroides]|uniref:hypothetical protein n=1 Tax=Cereibacter sphaeroides TaxID=1063 RepID=UPI001F303A23|nr:hypothetical protein [Cereibacter sphaeroides]MCE6959259.1 hypothetical protein [Cereibacter sphaeroides]MCE6971253.1 hypothetical protein [Cereibacter sphaeroides]
MPEDRKLIIPLWYRPADIDAGVPSNIVMRLDDGEEGILITRDTFAQLAEDLAGHDKPGFHVFDIAAEARAASRLRDHETGRGEQTDIGILKDGEGVLMVIDQGRPIEDDGFTIEDWRTPHRDAGTVYGSWELPQAECEALLAAPFGDAPSGRGAVLAEKIGGMPNPNVLRDVQAALESFSGAYVGFVSVSPEEIRGELRERGYRTDACTDDIVQPAILKACQKAEMSDPWNEAIEASIQRLRDRSPEAVVEDDGGPEEESGEEFQP